MEATMAQQEDQQTKAREDRAAERKMREDRLPEGQKWYHAIVEFVSDWGPRYLVNDDIKLSEEQAAKYLELDMIVEGRAEDAPENEVFEHQEAKRKRHAEASQEAAERRAEKEEAQQKEFLERRHAK
jgi:predicted AAA+ superfamily ATPase